MVTLGGDPSSWLHDLLHAWRDLVLPGLETTIVLVDPMAVDQAPNSVAQLLPIQRPDPFSKFVIITLSDTAVQRGLPRSCAIVTGDRVHLHGVLLMTDMLNQFPPEIIYNRCQLLFQDRLLVRDDYAQTSHGFVFKFGHPT